MRKNYKVRKTRPFEGKINQFKKEKLILCSLHEFDDFKKALENAHIDYELGDFYRNGIIVVKK